jgi:hypothetical protein
MTLTPRTHIILAGVLWSVLLLALPPAANAGQILGAPTYMGLSFGLTGWWTMDGNDTTKNNSGVVTAIDRSSTGIHGTLANGAVNAPGKIGQGVTFDGVNDKVSFPLDLDSFITTSLGSISIWIRPTGPSPAGTAAYDGDAIVVDAAAFLGIHRLDLSGTDGIWIYNWDGNEDSFAIPYTVDEWVHIVWVHSGGRLRGYKNGVLINDIASGNTTNIANQLSFGDSVYATGHDPYAGDLDDVRIYNRALAADEVKRLYKIGSTEKFGAPNSSGSLASGLVGWWTMDGADTSFNGSGLMTVADRSGNGNIATATAATAPIPVIGKIGQGLNLDGVNGYLRVSGLNPTTYNNFTVSAWFKSRLTTGLDDYDIIAHSDASYVDDFQFGPTDDASHVDTVRFDFFDSGSGDLYYGVTDVVDSAWHHLVGIRDSGTIKIYVDGRLDSSSADLSSGPVTINGRGPNIGTDAQNPLGNNTVDGIIDEVRIYNRALTTDEIKRLYKMGSTLKQGVASSNGSLSQGLVGWWPMDGNDTAVNSSGVLSAIDRSSSQNNAVASSVANSPRKVVGRIGQALQFDAAGDVLNAGSNAVFTLTDRTISAWIYPTSFGEGGNNGRIVDKGGSTGWSLSVESPSAMEYFVDCSGGSPSLSAITVNGAIGLNRWQHVVLTATSSTRLAAVQFYVNGAQVGLNGGASTDCTTEKSGDSGDSLLIGNSSDNPFTFDGSIDDFRVYNRVLTSDEIKRLYNMGR